MRLWRHGAAPGHDTQSVDVELTRLATQLSPAATADADAWAQDVYRRYFTANPYTNQSGNITICQREGS